VSLILLAFSALSSYAWKEKGAAEAKTELLQQQLTQKQATLNWLTKGYVDLKQANPISRSEVFSAVIVPS